MEMRTSNTEKVNNFIASLPPNLSEKNKNSRKLQFMAENGIRQLGLPRIGHFADKLRPEPMHCEINAWQHYIDLLYLEAVRIKKFDPFVSALAAPIGNRDGDIEEGQPQKTLLRVSDIDSVVERARKQEMLQKSEEDLKQYLQKTGFPHVRHATGEGGCGLGYLASRVKEHFSDETNRYNKLPVRLIGNQAIALARYYYRLVDTLESEDETEAQTIQRLALSKIGEYLRNAGGFLIE